MSEGAASLLPDQVRPALLWTLRLDARGEMVEVDLARALVRSRAQLTYEQAQSEIDGGGAREVLAVLAEVGRRREDLEAERGGVSLQIPAQEIEVDAAGQYTLTYRATLPVERYNAQISLLTGMAAAGLMLAGKIGVVRTLPAADPGALRRLRRTAQALRISWPKAQDYPEFVRSLDPTISAHAAMLNACTELFRGAGYTAFDGELPANTRHAALATDYSHVTAPLRRLVDRFAGEICLALSAGRNVPDWARSALPDLPELMAGAESRSKKYERAVIDLVEVSLLHDRVGSEFVGTVIDLESDGKRGTVMIADPAVQARVRGTDLPLGTEVRLRLESADWSTGRVEFVLI
jgi:exoribonuclease R